MDMAQCDFDSYDLTFKNQGGFGCIFSDNNQEYLKTHLGNTATSSPRYIRKITDIEHGRNEMKIGTIISKIPFYRDYFAVIEDSCSVDISPEELATTSEFSNREPREKHSEKHKNKNITELASCSLLTKKDYNMGKFISMKIPFIKGIELGDYNFTNTQELFYFYDYLLTGFNILFDNGIIHYDIKDNNIMIDENRKIPIIIDFGLSINTALFDHLKTDKEAWDDNIVDEINELFLSSGPYYRNIDIYIVIELLRKMPSITSTPSPGPGPGPSFDGSPIGEIFNKIFNNFFDKGRKHYDLEHYLNEEEIMEYRTECFNYYSTIYKNKIEVIINTILEKKDSWDNYGLAICMTGLLRKYKENRASSNNSNEENDNENKEVDEVGRFSYFLKRIISASPGSRPSLKTTQKELYELFQLESD